MDGAQMAQRNEMNRSISCYTGTTLAKNLHMRSGEGVQMWPDGRVYVGQWANHCYHGEGSLWHTLEEYARGPDAAFYRGQWYCGRRHGHGMLRFIQRTSRVSKGDDGGDDNGVSDVSLKPKFKVYEGEFRDDVFAGQGRIRNVCPAPYLGRTASRGYVPPPDLETDKMLSFEGYFRPDLAEAYDEVLKSDPTWLERNPGGDGALKLESISVDETDMFLHYFGSHSGDIQQTGNPMPDLAMAYYTINGKDTDVIDGYGTMHFTDGSQYTGDFLDGLPHGEGELRQLNRGTHESSPEEFASYAGQWLRGKRHGKGLYEVRGRTSYEGSWVDDARQGAGIHTTSPILESTYGYSLYDGEWSAGVRHGHGRTYRRNNAGENMVFYIGKWVNGQISASADSPAWMQLLARGQSQGRWYFGEFSAEGARETSLGYLYDEAVRDDPAFQNAIARGEPLVEDLAIKTLLDSDALQIQIPQALKHTLYAGPWHDDRPHGKGVQHFQEVGLYVGHFECGMRQGRGTFVRSDDLFSYIPIEGDTPNWENDQMHGVATIVSPEGTYEAINYKEGFCSVWRVGLSHVQVIKKVCCPTMAFDDNNPVRIIAKQKPGLARGQLI